MKTKLLTTAMMVAFIMTAMTKVQAQNFEGPCLPQMHGMDGHQSALCGSTQAIALESGVNWVSFYVEADLATLKAALVDATPNMAISIQSQTQNANYNPSNQRWTGRLTSLDLAYMYKITVAEDCEIMLDGMRVNPSEHQLMIDGLTWIAYPFAEPMSVTDVFAGFAVNGDVLQSSTQNTKYNRGRWQGQLTTLEPGHGYMYKVAGEARPFTFPANAK